MQRKYTVLFALIILALVASACAGEIQANDPGPTVHGKVYTMVVPLTNQTLGAVRAQWLQAHPGCSIVQDMVKGGGLVISYQCPSFEKGEQ